MHQSTSHRIHSPKLSLPTSLISYAFEHKKIKELQLFLFLKMSSSGKLSKKDSAWDVAYEELDIKDKRTFNKRLDWLLKNKWIIYNPASGYYFISSFERIRMALGLKKRRAVKMYFGDLKEFKAFCAGTIISINIKNQQYRSLVRKSKRERSASKKEDEANKDLFRPLSDDYFGLSNKIAQLLFCKQTNACELKNLAEKSGYLVTREKFRTLFILDKPDMNVIKGLDILAGAKACRIKCRRAYDNYEAIEVLYQLYDEIGVKVKFTNRKKI